jgi:hypothetical protein
MKKIMLILAAGICSMFMLNVTAGEIVKVAGVMEEGSLKIELDDSLNGSIVGKPCDTCKSIRVVITPDTQVVENNVIVPLTEAKKRKGKAAFVMYDVKTLKVTKIFW